MLNPKRYWLVVALLLVGISFLILPSYSNYCEGDKSNDYYCAAYEIMVTFGAFIDSHGNAVTAIATGVIAWFTITLAIVGRQQIKDTRILQRAYLNVLLGGIEPWTSDKKRLACDVWFFNAGNLPASRVTWKFTTCFSRDSHFNPPPIIINERHTNIVAPKSKIRKGADPPVDAAELIAFRAEGKEPCWLYMWGRVEYHDGFQDRRRIDFCHRYNLAGTKGLSISSRHGRQHEKGNSTDESQ